jgi:peptide chain release factor 1
MYARYAERQGWKMEIMDASDNAGSGNQRSRRVIEGDNVYSKMRFESGVHRVQRVPQTGIAGPIHTSAITVAVLARSRRGRRSDRSERPSYRHFLLSGPGGHRSTLPIRPFASHTCRRIRCLDAGRKIADQEP